MQPENKAAKEIVEIDPSKYIVIKTEIFKAFNEKTPTTAGELAQLLIAHPEAMLSNEPGSEDEHFVLMLKDVHTRSALIAYARSVALTGQRFYASCIQRLAERASDLNPFRKWPD